MWVLGIELRLSGMVTSVLTCWVVLQAFHCHFKEAVGYDVSGVNTGWPCLSPHPWEVGGESPRKLPVLYLGKERVWQVAVSPWSRKVVHGHIEPQRPCNVYIRMKVWACTDSHALCWCCQNNGVTVMSFLFVRWGHWVGVWNSATARDSVLLDAQG